MRLGENNIPTYVYQCPKCGKERDVFHGMSEKKVVKCKACKVRSKRIISPPAGIIFRGTGFYETDYKQKGM